MSEVSLPVGSQNKRWDTARNFIKKVLPSKPKETPTPSVEQAHPHYGSIVPLNSFPVDVARRIEAVKENKVRLSVGKTVIGLEQSPVKGSSGQGSIFLTELNPGFLANPLEVDYEDGRVIIIRKPSAKVRGGGKDLYHVEKDGKTVAAIGTLGKEVPLPQDGHLRFYQGIDRLDSGVQEVAVRNGQLSFSSVSPKKPTMI